MTGSAATDKRMTNAKPYPEVNNMSKNVTREQMENLLRKWGEAPEKIKMLQERVTEMEQYTRLSTAASRPVLSERVDGGTTGDPTAYTAQSAMDGQQRLEAFCGWINRQIDEINEYTIAMDKAIFMLGNQEIVLLFKVYREKKSIEEIMDDLEISESTFHRMRISILKSLTEDAELCNFLEAYTVRKAFSESNYVSGKAVQNTF